MRSTHNNARRVALVEAAALGLLGCAQLCFLYAVARIGCAVYHLCGG